MSQMVSYFPKNRQHICLRSRVIWKDSSFRTILILSAMFIIFALFIRFLVQFPKFSDGSLLGYLATDYILGTEISPLEIFSALKVLLDASSHLMRCL